MRRNLLFSNRVTPTSVKNAMLHLFPHFMAFLPRKTYPFIATGFFLPLAAHRFVSQRNSVTRFFTLQGHDNAMQEMPQAVENKNRSNVVIIAGPGGGTAFGSPQIHSLNQAFVTSGANVFVVGDGECNIGMDDIQAAVVAAAQKGGDVTVFIMAHGNVRSNGHVINIARNCEITSEALFQTLSRIVNRKLDVFMTCCHGGASIPVVNALPRGSVLVTLSPGNESVSGFDVKNLIDALSTDLVSNPSFTAENFLNIYLGKSLKNRRAPNRAVSGEGVHALIKKLRSCIGKEYSALDRGRVHQKLDTVIGMSEVDRLLNLMGAGKDEWAINAIEFGPCLAISDILRPQPINIQSYDTNETSYDRCTKGSLWEHRNSSTIRVENNSFVLPSNDRPINKK